MNDFVFNVILSGWFVTISSIIPMASQWVMVPIIVIIMIVYQLIIWFLQWYMYGEIGVLGFIRTIILFMLSILLYVGSYLLILVYGWEYIGVISFLLISFWQRADAMSSSISAVMYNRFSDFGILMFCYLMESWLLSIFAVLSNSALWVMGYWLPIAMESPTPVSSLLHSSTMVVASVILSMILSGSIVLGLTAIIVMSMFLPSWFDSKKIIALSTSVHLVVMFISVSVGMYGVCLMHILTHAFVNATCFVASSVKISITGNQELRWWGLDNQMIVIIMSFLLLCSVGGSLVYNSNEIVVFQMLMVIIVFVGWNYTNTFFNNAGSMNSALVKMQYSICMVFVISSSGFSGVELIILIVMMGGIMPVLNSWSSYVVNN